VREPVVAALDLSFSGLGAVVAPKSWDRRWSRVLASTFTFPLKKNATERDHTKRIRQLVRDVCTWLVWAGVAPHSTEPVTIEDLPSGRAFSIVPLAELRGVMRDELLSGFGVDVVFAPQAEARKLLYGTTPPRGLTPGDRKRWLLDPLHAAGAHFDDDNQGDAFCAMNWRMHELGIPCYLHLLGTPEHFEALRKEAAREKAKARAKKARVAA
jgi:hypothetical protein